MVGVKKPVLEQMLSQMGSVDLNLWNKDNLSPLLLAVKLGWEDLIDLLIKYGANID